MADSAREKADKAKKKAKKKSEEKGGFFSGLRRRSKEVDKYTDMLKGSRLPTEKKHR